MKNAMRNPRRPRLALGLGLLAGSLALAACGAPGAEPPAGDEAGSRLADVEPPEGFDFATSAEAHLEVEVSRAAVGGLEAGLLEVTTESGAVLHRGPVRVDALNELRLAAPTSEASLQLSLRGRDTRTSRRVELGAERIRVVFD
jgi:hypothetical protein